MTDSERAQILKMIDEGKITAEEGLKLMQALAQDEDVEAETPLLETESSGGAEWQPAPPDPVVERLKRRVRSFYVIPLFGGTFLTVLVAWLMYQSIETGSMGVMFYCLLFPALLLGILLLTLGAASQKSSWVYVDVQQKPGQKPGRIMLGFPLDLARWLMNTFKSNIPRNEREKADMVLQVMNETTSTEPIVVQVDEGEDGNKVNVYIG
ncbi:MAG: hypothetical protein L6461_03200 [Anaerolineae bacterium]|nr:hypothetical protein [Anaerolineae bacterium]